MNLHSKKNNIKKDFNNNNFNKIINKPRKQYSSALIIHLFALAHAVTAIMARLVNYTDDVPLTLLTIAMVVILSIRNRLDTKTAAIITFLSCFAGYAIGSYGERLILLIVEYKPIAPGLTTAIITEITGWVIYVLGKVSIASNKREENNFVTNQKENAFTDLNTSNNINTIESTTYKDNLPTTKQILFFAFLILILRILYATLFNPSDFSNQGIHFELQKIFDNTPAILFLICSNIILVSFTHSTKEYSSSTHKKKGNNKTLKEKAYVKLIIVLVVSILVSFIVSSRIYVTHPNVANGLWSLAFLRLFAAVLLIDTTLYAILRISIFASIANAEIILQKKKRHFAQFRYNKLKTQINPHFLFNSLNILDFLVQEQETERASNFIHKLAGTYRYIIQTEDKEVVTIAEELNFAYKYIDLLKERFVVGFIINIDIAEEYLHKFIIPCSLQLLIENATKHNAVSTENPLIINIYIQENNLVVKNNIRPKLTPVNSTGEGLKNIQQQYRDITGQEVTIIHTETEFIVSLPLFEV